MIRRLALPTLMVLAVSLPVAGQSPPASPGVTASTPPSPTSSASSAVGSPDPAQADVCRSLEILPERCYLAGSVRITTRGAVRDSVTWPLEKGVGATSDDIPSIALWYGLADDPRLAIDLPGVPGASTTPRDGDSAGRGEAQVWWSMPDSVAGYGHACSLRYEADAVGRLTGVIRCPRERTEHGRRYRVDVDLRRGPTGARPAADAGADAGSRAAIPRRHGLPPAGCCGHRGRADLKSGSVLLLDAGPGQCVGIAGDQEVAFVAVDESATAADLVPTAGSGARPVDPLLLELGDAASAASCAWPDGRASSSAASCRGSSLLAVSLSSDDPATDDALLAGLLTAALDRTRRGLPAVEPDYLGAASRPRQQPPDHRSGRVE